MGHTFLFGLDSDQHPMLHRMWRRLIQWVTWPFRKLEEACDLCDRH